MRRCLVVSLALAIAVGGLMTIPAPRVKAAVVNLLPTYEARYPASSSACLSPFYGYTFSNGAWFDCFSDTTNLGFTNWFLTFDLPASGAEIRSMPDTALTAATTYTLTVHYQSHLSYGPLRIGIARGDVPVLASQVVTLTQDSTYGFRTAAFTFTAPATASDYQLVFSFASSYARMAWDWMVLSQGSTPVTTWVPGSGVAFNHPGFYYSDASLLSSQNAWQYMYLSLQDADTTGASIARILVTTGTSSQWGTFGYCAAGTDSSNCQYVQLNNGPVYPPQWYTLPAGVTTVWTLNNGSSKFAQVTALLVTRAGLPAPTATTTPGAWSSVAGRGDVSLSWSPVYGADTYNLQIFDSYAYRTFSLGNVTSWDSDLARIYPDEATLDSLGDNTQTADLLNHAQGGLSLRDDPNKLYRKMANTTYDSNNNYWFRYQACDTATGQTVCITSPSAQPTLPNRTDSTLPQILGVTIDGGAAKTGDANVTVDVTAQDPAVPNYTSDPSDDASGVLWVRFSSDNQTWSNWQAFAQTATPPGQTVTRSFSWQLPALGEPNTVYVQVKDQAGNVSAPASAGIYYVLDTSPPAVSLGINSGAMSTSTTSVALTIIATDNISDASQLLMRFSNDGLSWSQWEPYRSTKSWTLSSGAGWKTVWVDVQDAQGNVGAATATILYLPTMGVGGGGILAAQDGVAGTFVINGTSQSVIWLTSSEATLLVSPPTPSQKFLSLSLDGFTWNPLFELQGAGVPLPITLPPGDGVRAVYARYSDQAGALSSTYRLLFVVDTRAPIVTASWLGNATVTAGGKQTLVIQASDNIAPISDLQVRVDVGSSTGNWIPFSGTIPVLFTQAGVNVVTVWVKDPAGNVGRAVLSIYN